MFNKKFIVSLVDYNWNVIERNIKLRVIPNKGEFIWYNEQYYSIINVIHILNDKNETLLVIKEVSEEKK